jgi:hypothetical protein
MTTTYIGGPEQSSSFLDHEAQDSALTYLADNWPHMPLTAAQREAWLDVLGKLRQGELMRALRDMNPGRFRPDAYAVLDAVLALRGGDKRRLERETPAERDTWKPDTAARAAADECLKAMAELGIGRRARA